jgi:ribulose-phosphate 3-epimerase
MSGDSQNSNMYQIIPAILPKIQSELNQKSKAVLGLVSYVQVDVCDGIFVPTKTVFKELPFMDGLEYELDLMIDQPEKTIEDYIELQPARIVIHLESVQDHVKLFLSLEQIRGIIEIGLSISNDTDDLLLEKYIEDCDFVQFMGISKIGFQEQSFDERVIERISYFHRKYPNLPISVDGSVNIETIKQLYDAGATRFVIGSAIYKSGKPEENIENFKKILEI